MAAWLGRLLACACLVSSGPLCGSSGNLDDLTRKYEDLLLLRASDYDTVGLADSTLQESLAAEFRRAVRHVGSFPYARRDEPAYFVSSPDSDEDPTDSQLAGGESNGEFHRLLNETLLALAYAYNTPGSEGQTNPYYRSSEVLQMYLGALDYSYSRGLDEHAWLPDHAGTASAKAIERGLVRSSGDFSRVSLRLGGFIQSVFLMRGSLADAGLLAKYRAVVRNLVVNHGVMYPAFFSIARKDAGISYPDPLPIKRHYHLNADGVRLFTDYFWPYFLLVEDTIERGAMSAILYHVIDTNLAIKPGVQGTIKPDGTGFHHGTAYVGAYAPFAIEAFAQLLYLAKGTTFYRAENFEAVKLALEAYRVMVQQYSTSAALRGRLIRGGGEGVSVAVSKAMAFLAHPNGLDDLEMKARFLEFFDESYFFSDERQNAYHEGARGLAIRGLGIYRLVSYLKGLAIAPSETPSGSVDQALCRGGLFPARGMAGHREGLQPVLLGLRGAVGLPPEQLRPELGVRLTGSLQRGLPGQRTGLRVRPVQRLGLVSRSRNHRKPLSD